MAVNRNRLSSALATIARLWVSEVARLQASDLWFDHPTGYGIPGFDGSCAVQTWRGPGRVAMASEESMSRQMVSDAIQGAVGSVSCSGARCSGIPARKGGLSTAIQAGVEEVVLYLQSGHGP